MIEKETWQQDTAIYISIGAPDYTHILCFAFDHRALVCSQCVVGLPRRRVKQ